MPQWAYEISPIKLGLINDLVSKEAASIGALYRDVSGYPEPVRGTLQAGLSEYTHAVIEQVWPEQRQGRILDTGTHVLNRFQSLHDHYQ